MKTACDLLPDCPLGRESLAKKEIKGFVQSATAVSMRHCDVIFATSFLQRHFCNIILIRRIIRIFHFGQNHRPHSCPCRQQQVYNLDQSVSHYPLNIYYMQPSRKSFRMGTCRIVSRYLCLCDLVDTGYYQIWAILATFRKEFLRCLK